MKVLYISDRSAGGIRSHVQCLLKALPSDVERYAIGEDEPFAGKNGHDFAEFLQIRRIIRAFKPDIIHFHTGPFFMLLYAHFFSDIPRVVSIHTSTNRPVTPKDKLLHILCSPCFYLPVSTPTWDSFKKFNPKAKGKVFFNSLFLPELPCKQKKTGPLIVGMVARNAEIKDWPSFHKVEKLVKARRPDVCFWNLGEDNFYSDSREKIGQMDILLITSKSEELPTTLLEAFGMKTAVCGFIPKGGITDVFKFSTGPVREAFLPGRDCNELANKVLELLDDRTKRDKIIVDGYRILSDHFNAVNNCRCELIQIYRSLLQ